MKKSFNALLMLIALLFAVFDANAQAPTAQARYIASTSIQSTSISLAWINGNGNKRIVVAYDVTTNGASDWASIRTFLDNYNSEYTANSNFTAAPAVDATLSNYKVVGQLNGPARTLTVTGLTAGRQYEFHVFEYNYYGTTAYYKTSAHTLNPRSLTTVNLLPPSNLANGTITNNSATISWDHSTGAIGYYLDVRLQNGAILTNYDLLDIGYVNSYFITGLNANTTYEWRLRAYNGTTISAATAWQSFTTTNVSTAPTVTSVVATPSILNKAGSSFSIAVTFDMEMDPTAYGTLTFSSDVSGTLTFEYGYWNSANTIYTAVYIVNPSSTETISNVNVTVPTNFTSADGNALASPHTANNVFSVDRAAPTVSSVSSTSADATYKIGDQIIFKLL